MQHLLVRYVDVFNQRIYPAQVFWSKGLIQRIEPVQDASALPFLVPGFVDAHVHIESSLLVPSAFARLAVVHGTVATVSDPHEIANVCGLSGVTFMLQDAARVPFKFFFGAPSCVPATRFETAGAELNVEAVTDLLNRPDIWYLSEMMNFPGVLHQDPEVLAKIEAANRAGKPVDGHAPGLRGPEVAAYIAAGMSTDHECFTAEEALEKLSLGMKILIREGSAARNFDALFPLIEDHWEQLMFCSDDKHPDSLMLGHINQLCARAVALGASPFKVLQMACINPVLHYQLPVGLLRCGDPADMVLVKDLQQFEVLATYIQGEQVAAAGMSTIPIIPVEPINQFVAYSVEPSDFDYPRQQPVIGLLDGQLITRKIPVARASDWPSDCLRIAVVNRYQQSKIAGAWISGMGLQRGALASSVAHDSHNIVVVGADPQSMARAVNLVMQHRGGLSAVDGSKEEVLPLPVAGLMAIGDGYAIANAYTRLDGMVKEMGATVSAPYMSVSFMALLVIPHLKLSDRGMFDGDDFCLIDPAALV